MRVLRALLVLATLAIFFYAFYVGVNIAVTRPHHVPVPDAQQFTFAYDPECASLNNTNQVLARVRGGCPGSTSTSPPPTPWVQGCEYTYTGRVAWAGMALTVVIMGVWWLATVATSEIWLCVDTHLEQHCCGDDCFCRYWCSMSFYVSACIAQLLFVASITGIAFGVLAAHPFALCTPAPAQPVASDALASAIDGCIVSLRDDREYAWALEMSKDCRNVIVTSGSDSDAQLAVPLVVADKVQAAIDSFKARVWQLLVVVWVLSVAQFVSCWPDCCWPRFRCCCSCPSSDAKSERAALVVNERQGDCCLE
jgi:hypothetical protein